MRSKRDIRLAVSIFIAISMALILTGLSNAGSLEPSDPPGPTMHTLDEIYSKPIWNMYDQVFVDWPGNPRFAVNDNGTPSDVTDDTVLDKETGLLWERNPSGRDYWDNAYYTCTAQKYYSGRKGWRLPTVQELASLLDMRVSAGSPKLPSGHPFVHAHLAGDFWSATTRFAFDTTYAWKVTFYDGIVLRLAINETNSAFVWCVRGGQGADSQ